MGHGVTVEICCHGAKFDLIAVRRPQPTYGTITGQAAINGMEAEAAFPETRDGRGGTLANKSSVAPRCGQAVLGGRSPRTNPFILKIFYFRFGQYCTVTLLYQAP